MRRHLLKGLESMPRFELWDWRSKKSRKDRRVMYFYLWQLLIPVAYLYQASAIQIIFGLLLIALFGLLYALSFSAQGTRRILLSVGMMTIMWGMAWWISAGYLAMIYYPAAILSFLGRRQLFTGFSILLFGSLIEIWALLSRFQAHLTTYIPTLFGVLFGVLAMTFMVRYYGKIHQTNEKLAKANAEIERLTKVAERERISRDLHDVMGHQLSMITLKAQVASKLLAKDYNVDLVRSEISDIERAAREALSRVRDYVADIRQANFCEEWASARALLNAASIQTNMSDCMPERWAGQAYQVLAMCLRESVTNIVRHSFASQAYVNVSTDDAGNIELIVADDGRGFTKRVGATDETKDVTLWSGNGLKGIRARVDAIGGRLDIIWGPQLGTDCSPCWTRLKIGFEPKVMLAIRVPQTPVFREVNL